MQTPTRRPGPGRPPFPKHQRRSLILKIHMTTAERLELERQARRHKSASLAGYIRQTLGLTA
jgi:hypothetical protein